MPRRTGKKVFTKEIEAQCLEAIATIGTIKAGYQAVDVADHTFYRWVKENPLFAEKVGEAINTHCNYTPAHVRALAQVVLLEYLTEGATFETNITEVEKKYIFELNKETGKREKILVGETRRSQKKESKRPCPYKVLEKALGKDMTVSDALKTLATEDIIPHEILEEVQEKLNDLQTQVKESFDSRLRRTVEAESN